MSSWGMRVTEASDGYSALQLVYEAMAADDPFGVVTIDKQMPGMDGETLGRTLRADPNLRDIHLIMLTAFEKPIDEEVFAEIGFSACLTKPVRKNDLKEIIIRALTNDTPSVTIMTRQSIQEKKKTPIEAAFEEGYFKILLAEDNVTNQLVARTMLQKLGLSTDTVNNGQEAIEQLCRRPYDLLFMDVQMPVLDGLEATRKIRQLEQDNQLAEHVIASQNAHLPIIAMTANAMDGDREECQAAGMDDYVSKPISSEALHEVLQKWLPQSRVETKTSENPRDKNTSEPSAEPYTNTPCVFNQTTVLEKFFGDKPTAKSVIEESVEDIEKQLNRLKALITEGGYDPVRRQAHTIKGASANIGAEALSAVAQQLEETGEDSFPYTMQTLYPKLEAEFRNLKQEVKTSLLKW
jgi:CheY-like chemotaxis protein/HPt (histidine-containing phosphotransfer) domain-containing protein